MPILSAVFHRLTTILFLFYLTYLVGRLPNPRKFAQYFTKNKHGIFTDR